MSQPTKQEEILARKPEHVPQETAILTGEILVKLLKHYEALPELKKAQYEAFELIPPKSLKDTTARRILCRFFVPVGRGRKQVGKKSIPLSQVGKAFIYKPRGLRTEPAEYYLNSKILDETFKIFPPNQNLLVADFWLNNPSQIDYSSFGRDIIADARELAQAHHRFVKKNLLEQDLTLYLILAVLGMVTMLGGIGYAFSVKPETIHIYTTPDGTQFVYKDGETLATGKGIASLPAPIVSAIERQTTTGAQTNDNNSGR